MEEEIKQEKVGTEQTVTILIMRLNQSMAALDSEIKFPGTKKPQTKEMYKDVYRDIFELSRLTRASLSETLLSDLLKWRNTYLFSDGFTDAAIFFVESIYDELSQSGMIDIRVRKTVSFPMSFYSDRLRNDGVL